MTQQQMTVDEVKAAAKPRKKSSRDTRKVIVIPHNAHATREGDAIRLVLPFPPSANSYWRHARGTTYLSAEAKDYRAIVQRIGESCQPFRGPVRMTARLFRPRRSGDLMNREKQLSDALQNVCFADDKQIVKAIFELFDDPGNPRVEIEVVSLGKVEGLLFDAPEKKSKRRQA